MLFANKKIFDTPPGPQGPVGVIFIWGPKCHFVVVLDVEIFFCFFFQNWLEMTQLDKLWMKNNFQTPTQPRASSKGHFYEGPRAILGSLFHNDLKVLLHYPVGASGGKSKLSASKNLGKKAIFITLSHSCATPCYPVFLRLNIPVLIGISWVFPFQHLNYSTSTSFGGHFWVKMTTSI